MDISALRHYNTGTFGHKNILVHEHFGRRMSVAKYLYCFPHCQNVHEPKYPCVKMFQYRNVPVLKHLWSQIILIMKCPCAQKSLWWSVVAEMSLAEMSGTEISPSHLQMGHWFQREWQGTSLHAVFNFVIANVLHHISMHYSMSDCCHFYPEEQTEPRFFKTEFPEQTITLLRKH